MKTTVLLLFAASIAIWGDASALESKIGDAFDFHAIELKVLSPDGKRTIGSTRFTVSREQSYELIKGETSYLDGEHDDETERLVVAGSDSTPTLDSYQHSFFNADGTLLMVDTLDAKSGLASCTRFTAASRKERKSKLEVPADSFAGTSDLMMVVASLRQGAHAVRFHAFACVPGPAISASRCLCRIARSAGRCILAISFASICGPISGC